MKTKTAAELFQMRRDLSLSICELSKRSGVSKGYISMLERGLSNNPSKNILTRLHLTLDHYERLIDFVKRIEEEHNI